MSAPPPPRSAAPPPPSRGGLSLYDNLLDPNDPAPPGETISAAPVRYNQSQGNTNEPRKPVDPALHFQPQIRRPVAKNAKPKPAFPKPVAKSAQAADPPAEQTATAAAALPKTKLADWTATEEEEWAYGQGEKPQRGGRKKRRKQQDEREATNWDDFYDPSRPTNVEEYLQSDEKINEVLEWKDVLYRHRRRRSSTGSSSDEDRSGAAAPSNRFAPSPAYAFAPPPPQQDVEMTDAVSQPPRSTSPPVYQAPPPPSVAATASPPPPPPPPEPPHAQLPPHTSPPPPTSADASTVISKAPIRYTQAQDIDPTLEEDKESLQADADLAPDADDTSQRSKRPGQAGFAQRLMSKYGWTKGSGLGAGVSGIVNPLRVQVDKRRKKADAKGGGWAEPSGKGKILGGKRKADDGKFGKMSEVIVLRNMLENMPDLVAEIANGLGQEIGEECGEKYGRVERLHIDPSARQVFIKFTDQISALRAINELDGRVFNGNTVQPAFYSADSFERGVYNVQ